MIEKIVQENAVEFVIEDKVLEISRSSTNIIEVVQAGIQGVKGQNGLDGAAGVGVPSGGLLGQVLKKASGSDYDTEWGDAGSSLGAKLYVQDTEPVWGTGEVALWVDTSGGNITFWVQDGT